VKVSRSAAIMTSWHHSWLRSKVSHGIAARPVFFAQRMRSSTRAWARWRASSGDVGLGLVGEERGEPEPVDVVEGLLRAGVQRFATHDQP
jgi:hypothetical protein